jgi:glutamine cyclotransferase
LTYALENQKLGYQNLKALSTMTVLALKLHTRIDLFQHNKLLKYKIINTYPHDTQSFTEGLEFYKDTLYESCSGTSASGCLQILFKKI